MFKDAVVNGIGDEDHGLRGRVGRLLADFTKNLHGAAETGAVASKENPAEVKHSCGISKSRLFGLCFLKVVVAAYVEHGGFGVVGYGAFKEILLFFDVHEFCEPWEGILNSGVQRAESAAF